MFSILLSLLVVIIVAGSAFWILSVLPLPQPWMNIAKVIVALLVLVWLLSILLPFSGSTHFHW